MNQNKYIIYYILYMEVIKEEKQPDGPNEDEVTLEEINKDVENIQVECKQINCNPVINTFKAIYKLICHLMKCFKFKNE